MKNNTSWIIAIVLVVGIVVGAVLYSDSVSNRPGQYDTFAACITTSGAKFYGAFWCPHCQAQKALFGNSAKKLPYVECSLPDGNGQLQVCNDKKIQSYPTWIFADGTTNVGEMSLEELASSTSCALTKDPVQ